MKTPRRLAEKRAEVEHMQDVRLLLDHLARSQETTIKLILDSLYDVGAVNLINKKIQSQSLNRLGKSAASVSKPVFRIIAYRWFKTNCPELIVGWLHKKVSFGETPPTTETVNALNAQTVDSLPGTTGSSQQLNQEIKQLRSQVRWLTSMLIGAIAFFGGITLWLVYSGEPGILRLREKQDSTVLELCASPQSSECSAQPLE